MPRHRLFTTHLGSGSHDPNEDFPGQALGFTLAPAAAEFRFAPSPSRRDWRWEWPAALLLHAAAIALALISFPPEPSFSPQNQSNVSLVFDNNSAAQQTGAPPARVQGPPLPAQAPPAAAAAPPPPPPQEFEQQTNLDIPESLFSQDALPPPAAQPHEVQNHRPARQYSRPVHQQYQVMNNLSYGNQQGQPAPPMPNAQQGLNLQLSQSDLNALNRPEITVQGEIGSDWMNGFDKWVRQHIYYPQAAAEQNQQGTSVIQFTVHRDGSVSGMRLLSSAGSPFLDQAWLGIFQPPNHVPAFPPGTKSDTIKITASLQYEILNGGGDDGDGP